MSTLSVDGDYSDYLSDYYSPPPTPPTHSVDGSMGDLDHYLSALINTHAKNQFEWGQVKFSLMHTLCLRRKLFPGTVLLSLSP
jgi:hypothetical protein